MNDNKLLVFTTPIIANEPHPIYGRYHLKKHEQECNAIDVFTATLTGDMNAVQQFIKNGNINVEDEDGYTPLHNAVSRRHHEVAKVLIPLSNINKQSKSGFTPLMNASAYGDDTMVSMLLEAGADVGARNIYGETAYDVAAMGEHASTCEIIQKAEIKWIRNHYSRQSNLQLRSHSSIQERLHCNFMEVLYENQRCSTFNFSFSADNLTESDFSLVGGALSTPFGSKKTFDEVTLPVGTQNQWFWLTDWKIDLSYPNVDENGWLYATSFEVSDESWGVNVPVSFFSRSTWVRRRRWIRVRKQRIPLNLSSCQPSSSTEGDKQISVSTEVYANDYISQALALVRISSPKRRSSSASIRGLITELESYEEAIQILLQGIEEDQNVARIEQGKSLAESYLRHADTLRSLLDTLKSSHPTISSQESIEGRSNDVVTSVSNQTTISAAMDSFPDVSPIGFARNSSSTQFLPAEWQTDNQAFDCRNCETIFTFFNRKHHCRWCGHIFCNSCTTQRLSLGRNPFFSSRVCEECHSYLTSSDSPIPHLAPQISPTRSEHRTSLNGLIECPVCQISLLRNMMTDIEASLHVANCLSNNNRDRSISGNMYVIQELEGDLDSECIICFEQFLEGQKIARLNCMCFYHQPCLEKWLSTPNYGVRSCPIHYS